MSKELTLIMIIIVLSIVVCGLIVAVIRLVKVVERSAEQIEGTNDYLLTRFLISERDKEESNPN